MDYYQLYTFRWKNPADRNAWMIRNKYRSPAERAFDLMADDKSDENQWLDAAQMLLAPIKNGRGLLGDTLRSQTDPSVSDLLLKRVMQSSTTWGDNLGLLLYQWDPPASLPALQRLAMRGRAYKGNLHGSIVAALLQLGDATFKEEWASSIKGDQIVTLDRLVPLWTLPNDEAVLVVARRLFMGPNAPMSPSNLLAAGRPAADLIRSPLLISPAFRESVFDALGRTLVIGTAERLPNGSLKLGMPDSSLWCMPGGCGRGFSVLRPPGARSIRLGDSVAYTLSSIDGFPEFDLEASTAEKDRAMAAIGAFLLLHGPDLRAPAITENMPWWTLAASLARK